MKIKSCAYAAGIAASLALLVACGEDVTKVTEVSEKASLDKVEKFKNLPKCNEDAEGSLVYVKDSAKVYSCDGENWVQLNGKDGSDGKNGKDGKDGADGKSGEDGASCTAKQNKDKTGFDIVCDGKTVGTIKNGEDGEDGKKGDKGDKGATGDKGADGTSCTAKQNKDKTGFDIVCGGETKGTIKNGDKGDDGQGCSLEDNGGQIVVTCGEQIATITKALCGTDPYDPAVSFCSDYNGVLGVFPLCHNALEGNEEELNEDGTYNVVSLFCDATDVLVYRCSSLAYDYTTQFCGPYGVRNRCNSVSEGVDETALNEDGTYDQVTHFCDAKGALYELCGASAYDTELQFCDREGENPQVVAYCGTGANKTTYDISTHMCVDGKVEDAWDCCIPTGQGKNWCNGHPESKYDVRTHFCDNRDGKPYKFTTIAPEGTNYSEVWMAENLNFEKVDEGEAACYKGDDADCDVYGRFYTYAGAQSYCPNDWHLPSKDEFFALYNAVHDAGAATVQAVSAALRATSWSTGVDKYGFTALAAGKYEGSFARTGVYTYYWTSNGTKIRLATNGGYFEEIMNNDAGNMYSVRCIKDKD